MWEIFVFLGGNFLTIVFTTFVVNVYTGYGFCAGNWHSWSWHSANPNTVRMAAWWKSCVPKWLLHQVSPKVLVYCFRRRLEPHVCWFLDLCNNFGWLFSWRWSQLVPMSQVEGYPAVFQVIWNVTPGLHQVSFVILLILKSVECLI